MTADDRMNALIRDYADGKITLEELKERLSPRHVRQGMCDELAMVRAEAPVRRIGSHR